MMKTNLGSVDRIARTFLAITFGILYFTGTVTGTVGLILLIVGVVFLFTALINSCPLYSLFGISTCAMKNQTV